MDMAPIHTDLCLPRFYFFFRVGDNLIEIGKPVGSVLKEDKVVAFEGVMDSSHGADNIQESTAVDEKMWRREMQTKLSHLDSAPKRMENAVASAPSHYDKKDTHLQSPGHGGRKNEVFKVRRNAAGS